MSRHLVVAVFIPSCLLGLSCNGREANTAAVEEAGPTMSSRVVAEAALPAKTSDAGSPSPPAFEPRSASVPSQGGPSVPTLSAAEPPTAGGGGADSAADSGASLADADSWFSGADMRSCDDLVEGWMNPLLVPGVTGDGQIVEPDVLTGGDAVSAYVETYLAFADIDPWMWPEGPPMDNEARVRLADHLASLLDAQDRYCGLVEADRARLAALRGPVPTLPPIGTVDEYTLWVEDRCARADKAMEESLAGMEALFTMMMEMDDQTYADETEPDRWDLFGRMHRALMLAEEIEARANVPPQAEPVHALMLEMAAEFYAVINGLGVTGPMPDAAAAAQVEEGRDRVIELCAQATDTADALRADSGGS